MPAVVAPTVIVSQPVEETPVSNRGVILNPSAERLVADEEVDDTKEEGIDMGKNTVGFGGIEGLVPVTVEPDTPMERLDVMPIGGIEDTPELRDEQVAYQAGKSKKWLIVVVAALVLWLLFKKRK